MLREDRDSIMASLQETVELPWRVEPIGPGTALHGPGIFREHGVQLVNDRKDVVPLIGLKKGVRRTDRVLKVFADGRYMPELQGDSFRGRGWQKRAIRAFEDAMKAIDALYE